MAVIDSGVDADHPQLRTAGKVLPGRDFFLVGRLAGNYDCVSHGTEVAGLIAAEPAAGIGFHGIAPGARILPVRVADRETEENGGTRVVDPTVLANGIIYAVNQGASVINLSLSGQRDHQVVRNAIAYAVRKDVVVVAAVGNRQTPEGGSLCSYPAAYPGVLGVGATDMSGARVHGSQIGSYVDLMAPGEGVLSSTRVSGHAYVSGTSFAAPFVAATAALVRSAWPRLTAAQVVQRLQATATPARGGVTGQEYGAGIVDPYRAVTEDLASATAKVPKATETPIDASVLARQHWWGDAASRTRRLAGLAVASAAALTLLGVALSAGRRRRWLAARSSIARTAAEHPKDQAAGAGLPLPEHLFGRQP
ncbi:hypothetical protein GCM10009745_38470 [Kribbella yunnanensis]|uniref:Peptidase S8/S53 domain-containing protein n=1 Tax=Kribbella yunnanensis TaxID=190194 RepID=A0ABN2HL24_9ACTN